MTFTSTDDTLPINSQEYLVSVQRPGGAFGGGYQVNGYDIAWYDVDSNTWMSSRIVGFDSEGKWAVTHWAELPALPHTVTDDKSTTTD